MPAIYRLVFTGGCERMPADFASLFKRAQELEKLLPQRAADSLRGPDERLNE